jgi:hypothetical protein
MMLTVIALRRRGVGWKRHVPVVLSGGLPWIHRVIKGLKTGWSSGWRRVENWITVKVSGSRSGGVEVGVVYEVSHWIELRVLAWGGLWMLG